MKKGTWVVCFDNSNWAPQAYMKMSDLPVKNELYQVRQFVPRIPGLTESQGIKLEGIYGEEDCFISKNGKAYWLECHFSANRFQKVNDLWSFLTERSDVEEESIDIRRNHQKLFSSLVNNGYENITDEERTYWNIVN